MIIQWSAASQADLGRLYDFLATVDPDLAAQMLDRLIEAPQALKSFPRRGSRLSQYDPREVRELRVLKYVLRYELRDGSVSVVRVFHAREKR